jgi:hypothetical protein
MISNSTVFEVKIVGQCVVLDKIRVFYEATKTVIDKYLVKQISKNGSIYIVIPSDLIRVTGFV